VYRAQVQKGLKNKGKICFGVTIGNEPRGQFSGEQEQR